ncbi:MAG: ABC transporter substrate-binding protein [Rhodospirillales bacterium]|nr:ABC transporter substrate-binding protein [Rhodospirillales bacterium]MBT6109274.1 ABC transporter substrate-binding protein [Rhodospirillales bacterium]
MTKKIENTDVDYGDMTGADRDLLTAALKRGATRREAMQMMAATGLSVAAAGAIVTSAEEAIAATPVKGGSVKMAPSLHGPDDAIVPAQFTSTVDYTRGRCHYNSLVQLNDDIIPQPELAQEFGANANATEWTFKLRKDVTFHDGSKFDADDVMYTMAQHYGDDSVSVVKSLVAGVEWKKVGQYEVKAILESPNSDLATLLGEKQFKIMKEGSAEEFRSGGALPTGTGPYALEDFQPGVRSKHVRNKNYWRDGPNFDEVEIFAITDPVARVNALLSRDVDMVAQVDPKAIKQVESTDGVQIKSNASGSYMGMCMMLDREPGNNPDFVKGMKLLHRRDKIVKSILKGQGTVGNDHPINEAYGADFCADLAIQDYDPDQAKHYLQKSGVTGAECVTAEVTPGMTDAVLMWQRECSKIGFDLQVKKVPTDGYWGSGWMQTPVNVVTWNMRPTATIMLDIAFAPTAPWNDTAWKNDRFGQLLTMAKAETNAAKRHEIQCEMQTLAHEGSGMIIPAHMNVVDGHASDIMSIPNLSLGILGGCEWPEFAWRA